MVTSRWAILKCKFSDDYSDLPPDALYERLFTRAGAGSFGMVDFFLDMSHGQIDVGDSQVFGWFTLPVGMDEYYDRLRHDISEGRGWLMDQCRRAADAAGVYLRPFDGVVATMNRGRQDGGRDGVDLWGSLGGREAFCDRYSLNPSALGQEMGHGYGLNHSRRDGSVAEYGDPWDTMSTFLAYMAANSDYGIIGPGLNAVNMRIARWFDESRLWRCSAGGFGGRVQLRPLHRRDLPGFLAVALPEPYRPGRELMVEFRVPERWDAAIPHPIVLVHREERRHSYLVRTLSEGEVLEYGRRGSPTHLRVKVVRIDQENESCDLDIWCGHASLADNLQSIAGRLSRQILGAIPYDGGGAVILPGGHIVPVGPWDPTLSILRSFAALEASEMIDDAGARLGAQRAALAGILETARAQLKALEPFRSPAPAPEKKLKKLKQRKAGK